MNANTSFIQNQVALCPESAVPRKTPFLSLTPEGVKVSIVVGCNGIKMNSAAALPLHVVALFA